ncbi:hypothetical protein HDU84_006914 [Entophlyctis sp. JEL0112]|nr:hypothetical protein HDU84_006914 [Entophlyctis sp. JEL0112]
MSGSSSSMHDGAKAYFERKDINLIMESIMAGLVFEQPEDPLEFIEDCVKRLKKESLSTPQVHRPQSQPVAKPKKSVRSKRVRWDKFIPFDAQEDNIKRQERALRRATNATVAELPKRGLLPALEHTKPQFNPNKKIFIVLGAPGSGKRTLCKMLAKDFGFLYLSLADIERKEIRQETALGKLCKEFAEGGKHLPEDVVIDMLRYAIHEKPDQQGYLIDGFPRFLTEIRDLEHKLTSTYTIISLICDPNILEKRIMEKEASNSSPSSGDIKERIRQSSELQKAIIDHSRKSVHSILEIECTETLQAVYSNLKTKISQDEKRTKDATPDRQAQPRSTATPHTLAKAPTPLPPIPTSGCTAPASSATENKPKPSSKAWKNIVFVLGGPGCGKGTQCDRIARDFNYTHLSAGDLLRAEVATGSPRALELAEIMKDGKIVPMEVTLRLLQEAMHSAPETANGFLIDGFPRALDQAIAFEERVAECKFVLMFDAPEDVLQQRLLKRGETSGRADDNIDTIKKRFRTFVDTSMPVIEYFAAKGKCVKISSVPHPDVVYASVRPHFENVGSAQRNVILVLGGPGSGKGTQCARLAQEFHLTHLSTGDLLRAEVQKGSAQVLFFNCPLEMLEARLLERGKTSGRADDNIDTIRKRFQTFQDESLPVLDLFSDRVLKIDSAGSVDEVYLRTKNHLFERHLVELHPATDEHNRKLHLPKTAERAELAETNNSDAPSLTVRREAKAWKNIVFVLGGPGCGKGTQCDRIARDFNYTHLSAGDLLRAEVATGSPRALELAEIMKDGKIVPMEVTLRLLQEAMHSAPETANGFLIDGFPRALDQAIAFEERVAECKFVLMFDAPEDVLQQRLLKRGETSGRADDNIDTIKKRFRTFVDTSMPVIEYFAAKGKCVKISSVPHPDVVYASVRPHFENVGSAQRNVILVLGGPGSGKGTQCARLAQEFHLTHLSTGDLLRAEVQKGSAVGQKCADLMREGKIVPMVGAVLVGNHRTCADCQNPQNTYCMQQVILDLLGTAMDNSRSGAGFLIDGFPRAVDQAIEFERTVCKARKVLFFNCPLEKLEARLLERGKTSGRADDNIDTIRKRFKTFQEESLPVLDVFQDRVLRIESTGTIDEVYAQVRSSLLAEGIVKRDPNIIFVLGGPGSGKGTQCAKLAKEFRLKHLSTGDLLRAELEKGTAIGKQCGELMKEGKIVPMDIILGLLKAAIAEAGDVPGFLIDGFPRAKDQAIEFERAICPAKQVLFFNCPLEMLEARLLERGKTSGRADDNIDTIRKRFQTFQDESLPVLDLFSDRVLKIDSIGSVDEVYSILRNEVLSAAIIKEDPKVIFVLGGPGSGKGTHCERLSREFRLLHLSTGDLLRAEVEKGSRTGKECSDLMKEGKMVPTETILSLLRAAISNSSESRGFLIDGFPRTTDQAIQFEKSVCQAQSVVFFDCPLGMLEERLIERGKTSGRVDDNIDTIRQRFNVFERESMPVIDLFQDRLLKIDGTGSIDDVYSKVKYSMISEGLCSEEPNVIFVLGGPGSGKGTQCKKIAEEFALTHLSTGDLLRAEAEKGSPIGKRCAYLMKEGKNVPMDIILKLLKDAIGKKINSSPGFLIDGFPRAKEQAIEFEKRICQAKKVLFFDCPLQVLEARLLERGKTSGRVDDNLETIRKRFRTFEEESYPVVEFLGGKVLRFESTGTIDEVYATVKNQLLSEGLVKHLPFEGSNIVFVLGGPGSGKGTQCMRLVESLKYAHLSTGDLLREEIKRGTSLGAELEEIMREGKMVPLEITLRLLTTAMDGLKSKVPGFLIDGFPRTMEQALEFEKTVGHCKFVLYFDAPEEVLTERLVKRGETSGRADDNLNSIRKRLNTFISTSMPVIKYFGQDKRVRRVSAVGNEADITAATLSLFE